MIPDFEKTNERMEQASLKELMPDFDKEMEWQKLSGQLHPAKRRKLIPTWSYAAAILLLIAGGIGFALFTSKGNDHPVATTQPVPGVRAKVNTTVPDTSVNVKVTIAEVNNNENEIKPTKNIVSTKQRKPGRKGYGTVSNYSTKDIICNGTPCPIQICINQTVRCPDIQPAKISSCSTLEPDQSGKLSYKAHDKIAKNCSLTINEIEITSIATGETILLNEYSTPSTAQDVFNYISGRKKGDILAGMFTSDCNHKTKKRDLRVINNYGDLMIQ